MRRAAQIVTDALPEEQATTWTADSFTAFYAQRMSIAVQRANAKAIRLRSARDFRIAGFPDHIPAPTEGD